MKKKSKIPATKEDINGILGCLISRHFHKIKWKNPDGQEPGQKSYIDLSYSKDKDIIRKLLLLYNIEYIVRQCDNTHLMYKFPFKSFKEGTPAGGKLFTTWDVEHIDSYTENGLNDKHSQKIWLESSVQVLSMRELELEAFKIPDNNGEANLREKIKKYLEVLEVKEHNDDEFQELRYQIRRVVREDGNDEELKNNIGNLTLLDSGTNRGYGNALFRSKREIVIKKDRDGAFIPVCTKNVFLKYFDTGGVSPASWSKTDIENYREDIAVTLKKFLPSRPGKGA
jgi:hypothetical protein